MDPHRNSALHDAPPFLQPQRSTGIGTAAWPLAGATAGRGRAGVERQTVAGLPGFPHFAPKAKRVIYLFQSGGPSQMDLFDYKPKLREDARRPSCPIRSARASGSPA